MPDMWGLWKETVHIRMTDDKFVGKKWRLNLGLFENIYEFVWRFQSYFYCCYYCHIRKAEIRNTRSPYLLAWIVHLSLHVLIRLNYLEVWKRVAPPPLSPDVASKPKSKHKWFLVVVPDNRQFTSALPEGKSNIDLSAPSTYLWRGDSRPSTAKEKKKNNKQTKTCTKIIW